MREYLEKGFRYIAKAEKKVMVTHIHPAGSVIEKASFAGSKAVAKAIKKFKPDIHICSHIHEMEGIEEKIGRTRVICVGQAGKIIEV